MIVALSKDPRIAANSVCDEDVEPQLREIATVFQAFSRKRRLCTSKDPWRRWFSISFDNVRWLYWYAWYLNINYVHRFTGKDYVPFDEIIAPAYDALARMSRTEGIVTPFPLLSEEGALDPVLSYQRWYARERSSGTWKERPAWMDETVHGGIFHEDQEF